MQTREHPVAGQPPAWSRPGQSFRHLDGRPVDWREGPAVRHRARAGAPATRGLRGIVSRLKQAWTRAVRAWLDAVLPLDPASFLAGEVWMGGVLVSCWLLVHFL